MHLYFVRHGESEANLAREFSNRGFKHPLTTRGMSQAQSLAKRLTNHPITQIYSSPLQRAVQTAEVLADRFQIPVVITDALREWDTGILEGRTDDVAWEMHHQIQETWMLQQQWEQRIPEGESFLDIQARFVPFIETLIQEATPEANENILLVGHGGLYLAMLPLILQNVTYNFVMQHALDNTDYVLAETGVDGLVCREWCGTKVEPNS